MEAVLVLEDGTVFKGLSFGAEGRKPGEVVFNTGMVGYQEIVTDPSYAGQIVTLTYPLIGNYGTTPEDNESAHPQVRGLIVREACPVPSNWRAEKSLSDYLRDFDIVAMEGIDTRALTRRLRTAGTMRGILSTDPKDVADPAALIEELKSFQPFGRQLLREVSTPKSYQVPGGKYRVAVIDLGIKQNILRLLHAHDCELTVFPHTATAEDILSQNPDGIFLSNGPGDPKDAVEAVETLKEILGRKPVFGICLGHQITALALGANTYKMKFGHRGVNHPVKDLASDRVYITSQNHGFAIDETSIAGKDILVTHRNLNDRTVEGLRHLSLPVFTVQYHPEAAPGPHDSEYLFDQFIKAMGNNRN